MLVEFSLDSRKVELASYLANSIQETTPLLPSLHWSSLPRLEPIIDA